MNRIISILLFLSIANIVASFDWKSLEGQTVHSEEDKAGYKPYQDKTHPAPFKLEKYLEKTDGIPYPDYPTFTATIKRANRSLDQTPKRVYVKIAILSEVDIEKCRFFHGYFESCDKFNGYLHVCQTANVTDPKSSNGSQRILYLAIEADMIKTFIPEVERFFGDEEARIMQDYLNKFQNPKDGTEEAGQLRSFELRRRVKGQFHYCNLFSTTISKVNSPADQKIEAVVLIFSSHSLNEFVDEFKKFAQKPERKGKINRLLKHPLIGGNKLWDWSVAVIEVQNLDDFFTMSEYVTPEHGIYLNFEGHKVTDNDKNVESFTLNFYKFIHWHIDQSYGQFETQIQVSKYQKRTAKVLLKLTEHGLTNKDLIEERDRILKKNENRFIYKRFIEHGTVCKKSVSAFIYILD